jgi:hypothetical protein
MSDTDLIEAATLRLSQALEALEAATERRREADRAEGRALEAANREVAQRIDQAIETIRGVLEFGN